MNILMFQTKRSFAKSMLQRKLLALASLLFFACASQVCPFLIFQSASAAEAAPLKLDFIVSEPTALVCFVDTLAARPHSTSWYKDWYQSKCVADSKGKKILAEDKVFLDKYNRLMDGENHYQFLDKVTRHTFDIGQKVLYLSVSCKTLPELLDKIKVEFSSADYETLKQTFEYFEPTYKKMVWEPCQERLQKQVAEIREAAVKMKMAERLNATRVFLKANWPGETPFSVAFVPLPIQHKHSHGTSIGNVQIVELKPESNFESSADVIFHEDCHALWFSKENLDSDEKEFVSSKYGPLPITELYEGIATALGQGWFAIEAFGKAPGQWYNDKTIDRYAHAIYPLCAEYLKEGRTLDAAFAKKATEIYFEEFPDAGSLVNETSSLYVFTDRVSEMAALKSGLNRYMPRLRELSISQQLGNFQAIKDAPSKHVAILVSKDKIDQFASFGLSELQLSALKNASGKPITIEVAGKQLLFCVADSPDKQQSMLFGVLKSPKWPKHSI